MAKGGSSVTRLVAGSLRSVSGPPGWPSSPQWPSTAPLPTGFIQGPAWQPRRWLPFPVWGSALAVPLGPVGQVPLPLPLASPRGREGVLAPSGCLQSGPPSDRLPSGGPPAGDPRHPVATPLSPISHPGRPICLPPEGILVRAAGSFPCFSHRQRGPALLAVLPTAGHTLALAGCQATPAFSCSSLSPAPHSPTSRCRVPCAVPCLPLGPPFASCSPHPSASHSPDPLSSSCLSVLVTFPARLQSSMAGYFF